MKNSLAIDIGNSRTKLAAFDDKQLLLKTVWEDLTVEALKELAYNQKIGKVILSSVKQVIPEVEQFLKTHFYYLELTPETPLPISIRYKPPATLGNDRIAAAVGAFKLYPGKNCLVIDAGTCITADLLNVAGEFLGGNISPGVEMRLKAMHQFTARLPLVERDLEAPPGSTGFLGDSTENALRNGAEQGAVLEMKAFIQICRREFRPLQVFLTGGDADFFASKFKTKIFANQNLVLEGLQKILQYNVQISKDK